MELKVGMKAKVGNDGYVTLTSLSSGQGSLFYHWPERVDLHNTTKSVEQFVIAKHFREFLIVPKWKVSFSYSKRGRVA